MSTLTQTTTPITTIRFPEVKLQTRDAHKLRGYFGELFREHSPILHNHYEDGRFRYRYPSVQYKVLDSVPTLVGIGEGAELLPQLFLKIREIDIDGRNYPVNTKNIDHRKVEIGFAQQLISYRFETLWMALNQENYRIYSAKESPDEKQNMLNSILVGHVLSVFRNLNIELTPEQRLMAMVKVKEKSAGFKDQKMIAFSGEFVINANLPDYMGLGKAVSRGFGTVKKC